MRNAIVYISSMESRAASVLSGIKRVLRGAALFSLASVAAACAHRPHGSAVVDENAALPTVSAGEQVVYDLVLAHVAREFGLGDTIRARVSTMALCDPAETVMYMDCIRERNFAALESPWANGRSVFDTLITDSTRRQLAAAFRTSSVVPQRLLPRDTSVVVFRTRDEMWAETSAAGPGQGPGSIVVARAAYSSDGHAVIYAVFSRLRFANGLLFLLRKDGDRWSILSRVDVWAT